MAFFKQLKGQLYLTISSGGPAPYRVTYRLDPPVQEAEVVIHYLREPLEDLAYEKARDYFKGKTLGSCHLQAIYDHESGDLVEIQALVYTTQQERALRDEIEEAYRSLHGGICPICGEPFEPGRYNTIACRDCKDYLFRVRKTAQRLANLDFSKFKEAMDREKAKWEEHARKKRLRGRDPVNWDVLLKMLWKEAVIYTIPENLRTRIAEIK